MSVMGLFFVFIASIAVTWLWRQGVMSSTWLAEGEVANYPGEALSPPPAAKVGLGRLSGGSRLSLLFDDGSLFHAYGVV